MPSTLYQYPLLLRFCPSTCQEAGRKKERKEVPSVKMGILHASLFVCLNNMHIERLIVEACIPYELLFDM